MSERNPTPAQQEKLDKIATIEAIIRKPPPAWQQWGVVRTGAYLREVEKARQLIGRKTKSRPELDYTITQLRAFEVEEQAA